MADGMGTDAPEISTDTLAPVVDSSVAPEIAPATSADGRVEPPHPLEERQQDRRPAKKDRATPKDVPTIQALSSVIRELTVKDEKDAPRVAELRQKLRAAMALDADPAPKSIEPKRDVPMPVQAAPIPGEFAESEPTIEQFQNEIDPYAAWLRACNRYDRRKETHDANRAHAKTQSDLAQSEQLKNWNQTLTDHAARIQHAKTTKYTDWDTVVSGVQTTNFMNDVIASMPNSADVIYSLAKDKNSLEELTLLSMSLPVTPDSVALLQRRMNARLGAVTAGAAPTKPVLVAPRPPTPARTGVMTTGETPPGDDSDLEAHKRAYGVGARRRR